MSFKLYIALLFLFYCGSVYSQDCSRVSSSRNKKEGTRTFGGTVSTLHSYTCLIQKTLNNRDTAIKPTYSLFIHAASRVLLSDSMLKTTGMMQIQLSDLTELKYDSVKYYNNPFGFGPALGFMVSLSEEQMKMLASNPILKLSVLNGSLKTSFSPRGLGQQKDIINCLLKK